MIQPGCKYLITADDWFFAPDGENYRAAWGTVHSVVDAQSVLGIKANRNSTNWYVVIGDMIIAGCRIHYAVRADGFNPAPPSAEVDHEGRRVEARCVTSRIYNADASRMTAFVG